MVDKKPVYRMVCIENGVNASLYSSVYDFYEQNRHNFNAERDPLALLDSLKNGSAVCIKDPDDQIVAVSLTFRYGNRHTETGGTRVVKNGFGLQRFMKWYQVVSDHIFRPPDGVYFAVIAKNNDASRVNIERCGFSEIEVSGDFLFDLGIYAGSDTFQEKSIFAFDKNQLSNIAGCLLDIHRNPIIKNKKTGEEIIFRIEGALCRNKGLLDIVEKLENSGS